MKLRASLRRSVVLFAACFGSLAALPLFAAEAPLPEMTEQDRSINMQMRSPAETIAAIKLPEGYHLELIASEPQIISPVVCCWDGNGRMYVAEMRSYMLDINGSKEKETVSRVSRFEDTKGNGVYDKQTVFADNLLLPRMVLPLDDRILIRETDTKDVYAYRDTKGTGTADEKTLIFKGGQQGGNLEHQPSGLLWNIDNWMYITADGVRYRYTRGKWESSSVAGLGQWGLALDDTGRTYFNTAGGENPGFGFQVNPMYGDIRLRGELADHFVDAYPLLKMTDVQGGPGRLWPGGGLNHITGCAGGSVYRGDALPGDLYGDYILPEPVGRFIRRGKITNEDGKIVLTNPYDHDEFIRSADPNFRPVWTATGPDGCLYICDMYHGIIQESAWTNPGSYLRPHIQKYGLDKNINAGRIYRLTHDGAKLREKPHMLDESPADLVKHLSDPNGWWRDTAQKLLVLRNDKSVLPALKELALKSNNPLARLHALWTIDGMDAIEPDFVTEKMKDADPRVRSAAVRISEPLIQKNDATVMSALGTIASDSDPNVIIQYCMSLLYVKHPQAEPLVKAALDSHEKNEAIQGIVKSHYDTLAKAKIEQAVGAALYRRDPKLAAIAAVGKVNYSQSCIVCHGPDGKGVQVPGAAAGVTLAPPLKGSKRLLGDKQTMLRIVIHGLSGPNEGGKTYPGEMAGFKWAEDPWLAATITYARNDFGNSAPAVTAEDIAKVRKETEGREKPFTLEELAGGKPPQAEKK
jgi:mono/diheme cytochrome c family protein